MIDPENTTFDRFGKPAKPDHRCRWLISPPMYSVPAVYCLKESKYTVSFDGGRDYYNVCAHHSEHYKDHKDYKLYPRDKRLIVMT